MLKEQIFAHYIDFLTLFIISIVSTIVNKLELNPLFQKNNNAKTEEEFLDSISLKDAKTDSEEEIKHSASKQSTTSKVFNYFQELVENKETRKSFTFEVIQVFLVLLLCLFIFEYIQSI